MYKVKKVSGHRFTTPNGDEHIAVETGFIIIDCETGFAVKASALQPYVYSSKRMAIADAETMNEKTKRV